MNQGRPGTVTAAAALLLVIAALNIIGGIAFIAGAGSVERSETALRLVGILDVFIGAVQVYAGVKVMALEQSGRKVGLAVSAIGAGLALLAIGQGGAGQILGLALNGFILGTLIRERESFIR